MMQEFEIENERYTYIISPYGLGDTFMLCIFKQSIEEKYKVTVKFVIKESHIDIVEMFGFEYVVRKYSDEQLYEISRENKKISAGKLFVAHPHYLDFKLELDFFEHRISFWEFYEKTLGLEGILFPKLEINYPEITEELKNKIAPFSVEDVVIYAPEMSSYRAFIDYPPIEWVKKFGLQLKRDNKKLIINAVNKEIIKEFDSVTSLTLKELIALCIHCKEVISIRSGLCDLICLACRRLNVIYTTIDYFENYSLKSVFPQHRLNGRLKEYCINYKEYFTINNLNICAIYGMGENGKRLYRTLKYQGIIVKYGIDRRKDTISSELEIFSPEDNYPKVDCIIVCVMNGFEEIKKHLSSKNKKTKILNIWEIDFWNVNMPLKEI